MSRPAGDGPRLDHLVVTAPTLAAGAAYVQRALGVAPQPGGRHTRMGTHNLLLRLGAAAYLEVIAIDPDAPAPGRPRWFGLDLLHAGSAPRLTTWVLRTADIDAAAAAAAGEGLGAIEPMSRGALHWRITIPQDGRPPLGGVAPALIEWRPGDPHPASGLHDLGCSLHRLALRHPAPERVTALLGALALDDGGVVQAVAGAAAQPPTLVAQVHTPHGLRTLGGGDECDCDDDEPASPAR